MKMFSSCITSLMVTCMLVMRGTSAVSLIRNSAGLTSLPTDISADITHIQVKSNSIEEIDSGLLTQLSELLEISAQHNSIHTFPNLCGITAAGTIKYLYLDYNDITEIPYASLDCLTMIFNLFISSNDIVSVPDAPGPGNTLGFLNIHYNQITSMPAWQHLANRLIKLNIAGNDLDNVTSDILQNMPNCHDIDMSDTQQYFFPNFSHIATKLKVIRLQLNFISVIPYELLNQLTELWYLELSSNQLASFPDVTDVPLIHLYLSGNQFTHMPAFSTVKLTLETLFLIRNYGITLEDDDFVGCIALRNLQLEYNPIPFPNLNPVKPTLVNLYIRNAAVTNIPVELLEGFHALQKLDLFNNQLSEIPNVALGPSDCTLETLYLGMNEFTVFPDMSLLGRCLITLHIQMNQITVIPAESISSMTSLTYLSLDQNPLAVFPDLRNIAVSLTYLYIRGSHTLSSIPEEYLHFGDDKTNSILIYLDNQLLETIPAVNASRATSVTITAPGNNLICDSSFRWAIAEPRFTVTGTCAKPSNVQGLSPTSLSLNHIAASSIELGDVEDPVSLNDGLLDTCTRIKRVRRKIISVCSLFPSQLLLRLLGGFDLVTDFTLRVTVTYKGGGCEADDLAMYTVTDDVIGSCDMSDVSTAVQNMQLCQLVTQQHDVYGTQQCVFECSKALHMTTFIAFSVSQATVCDVAYAKITHG